VVRARRGPSAIAWVVLALLGPVLAACPAQTAPTPQPPPPAPAPEPEPAPAPAPAAALPQAVESGFTHCCGNDQFRIEIDCRGMMKRCYESRRGEWKQTYGRHCLKSLGEDCYLSECDSRCQ
jgi:hypothetical protein